MDEAGERPHACHSALRKRLPALVSALYAACCAGILCKRISMWASACGGVPERAARAPSAAAPDGQRRQPAAAQACVVAAREARALPAGAALRARAVMYLALLAGAALARLRALPSPMYLASALADPAVPQARPAPPAPRAAVLARASAPPARQRPAPGQRRCLRGAARAALARALGGGGRPRAR